MVFVPGGLVFNNGPFTMTHEGLKDLGKDNKKRLTRGAICGHTRFKLTFRRMILKRQFISEG